MKHHGVHFLESKEKTLLIDASNKNDTIETLGPPSTQSYFDNELWIYIERKTTSTKVSKLGKKQLLVNNVLLMEFDDRGVLMSKKFYNKNDINQIKFNENETTINTSKQSFIYNFFNSMRQKIDDPLGCLLYTSPSPRD